MSIGYLKCALLLATLAVAELPTSMAAAQGVPQTCHRGAELLRQKEFQASIDAHSQCLNSGPLSRKDLASAFVNRGLANAALALPEYHVSDETTQRHLQNAIADLSEALVIEPNDAFALCVRGWAKLELSFGSSEEGRDDIRKGRALGATDDFWCNDQ